MDIDIASWSSNFQAGSCRKNIKRTVLSLYLKWKKLFYFCPTLIKFIWGTIFPVRRLQWKLMNLIIFLHDWKLCDIRFKNKTSQFPTQIQHMLTFFRMLYHKRRNKSLSWFLSKIHHGFSDHVNYPLEIRITNKRTANQ